MTTKNKLRLSSAAKLGKKNIFLGLPISRSQRTKQFITNEQRITELQLAPPNFQARG